MDDLLTVEEVAKELKVHIRTVYQMIQSNRLKAINIGTGSRGSFRIRRSALEALLQ